MMRQHYRRKLIARLPFNRLRTRLPQRDQLAVLIDADNVSPRYAADLFVEIATLGIPVAIRIYGNVTSMPNGWTQLARRRGARTIQCFRTANKKNSADIALAVDAVQMLYTRRNLSGFCIVSSDPDFSHVASMLRENGRSAYVFGNDATPDALKGSCTQFFSLEALSSRRHGLAESDAKRWKRPIKDAERVLLPAIMSLGGGHTPIALNVLGTHIRHLEPDFDPRNYRCRSLSELLVRCDLTEVEGSGPSATVRFRHCASSVSPLL